MTVTAEAVARIARLARLELDRDELRRMTLELNQIITFVRRLEEIDAGGEGGTGALPDRITPLRPDEPADFPNSR